MAKITVIGGANVDIRASAASALRMRESNPGSVSAALGGVGRNIAHNLALLGAETHLITVYGADEEARRIRRSCRALGIDDKDSPVFLDGARTGSYVYLTDERGDMLAAVSDMAIFDRFTPDLLAPRMAKINGSDAVIADANLPAETLVYLAEHCTAPLYADPVSAAKCVRLKEILWKLRGCKPNRAEASELTGIEGNTVNAARALLRAGVERVFLSLGEQGLFAASAEEAFLTPVFPTKIVNTTGAGDAMTAAMVWAELQGFSLREQALLALAAASLTMERAETVSPLLSENALLERANLE